MFWFWSVQYDSKMQDIPKSINTQIFIINDLSLPENFNRNDRLSTHTHHTYKSNMWDSFSLFIFKTNDMQFYRINVHMNE